MTEILQLPYQEPNTEGALGRDIGEGTTSRAHYDDVDDYHQWSSSPPQHKNGSAILLTENYTRSVEVCWVHPSDLSQSIATATGVKRIDVKVSCNGTPVATLTAFRTSAWVMDLDGSGWSATPSNNPPTAVAIGDPLTGYPPLTVIFYAGGSEDTDGDPLTYDWDFGDGNSNSGESVNHAYMNPGTYNITLTVSDGRGGMDVDMLTVIVKTIG
ncbi:MAG: PKD domain-containing protein [Planctomycetota bacterium]|nr:MAG: PKD domain-containing protein [Planctomycetota bacterium]